MTSISINFVGTATSMGSTEVAGAIPLSNWNQITAASGSGFALLDSTGSSTGATLTWSAADNWQSPIPDSPGNYRMMKGYLDDGDASNATVTVAGLPASPYGYNVYVYFDGDNSTETRSATYSIGSTSIVGIDAGGGDFAGNFLQAANNNAGNYVVFRSLAVTGFTLTAAPLASSGSTLRAPVNGIQIIPVAYQPIVFSNHAGTTLAAAITTTTRPVTFTVASAAGLPASGIFPVIIDNEILWITTISGTSLTGSNAEGTTAATHAIGANVTEIVTAGSRSQVQIDTNNGVGAAPNVVSYSATPTFDLSLSRSQQITLSGNVTSSSFTNITPGQRVTFLIIQDSTGGRTFTWPAGIHGAPVITGLPANSAALVAFMCYSTAASGMYVDGTPSINQ